ncbi:MAG: phosphoglycerate mutase family protein [Rhodospirillales bacterium]|nr:phosphoglycerate mutase family protein [Rhodospirillales bacterium]MCB9995306.1 phosphoglycerate mutase family protein [Rhodospirillales bacterium]
MQNTFNHEAPGQKQIWLLRHGTNEAGQAGEDPPLSAQGQQEIEAVSSFLAGRELCSPIMILSSSFLRVVQTTEILEQALGQAGYDEIYRFQADEVAGGSQDIVKILQLMNVLDQPKHKGIPVKTDNPIGTLILVGNKRNSLLEMMRIMIDPRSEIAMMRGDGTRPDEIDMDYVMDVLGDEEALQAYLGNDDEFKILEKAHLTGYSLNVPNWCACHKPGFGTLIEDRASADIVDAPRFHSVVKPT